MKGATHFLFLHEKELDGGTWKAQWKVPGKPLPLAQVMISGSWDRDPHWALCSAGSLLPPLSLLAALPPCNLCLSNKLKMSILPRETYTFNATLIQIPLAFFKELKQTITKYVWNQKIPRIDKEMLKKENKSGGLTLPDCKFYCKVVISKTAMYLHKNRHIVQWNRGECPDMEPQLYVQIIFNKVGKNTRWKKVSSINGAGKFG